MFKRSRKSQKKNHAIAAKCQLTELENKLSFKQGTLKPSFYQASSILTLELCKSYKESLKALFFLELI